MPVVTLVEVTLKRSRDLVPFVSINCQFSLVILHVALLCHLLLTFHVLVDLSRYFMEQIHMLSSCYECTLVRIVPFLASSSGLRVSDMPLSPNTLATVLLLIAECMFKIFLSLIVVLKVVSLLLRNSMVAWPL